MKTLQADTRKAVALLYAAAAVVFLEQLSEIFALVYPFHTEVASWRFGLLGMTVSRLGDFVLADAMLLIAAYLLEHRAFLRVLGLIHLVTAIVLLPAMAFYALDSLVLRKSIKPEFVRGFDITAARTLLTLGIAFLLSAIIFWITYRAPRSQATEKKEAKGLLLTDLAARESE